MKFWQKQVGSLFGPPCISACYVLLPPPRRLCFCRTLSVCLSVCEQDNSKSYWRIFLKFWGHGGHGINHQWFNFGRDPAEILDSGSLWNFRYHCVKGGIREPLAKWRWWRHLAIALPWRRYLRAMTALSRYCIVSLFAVQCCRPDSCKLCSAGQQPKHGAIWVSLELCKFVGYKCLH